MLRYLTVISAAAVLFSATAFAGTITQTQCFAGDVGNVAEAYTFDQFDDQGGTLTLQSVEIIVSLCATGGQRTVDNDDSIAASGTVEIGVTGGISSSDVNLSNIGALVTASSSDALSVDPDDGDVEVGGTAGVSVDGVDAATFFAGVSTDGDQGLVPNGAWGLGNTGYIGTGSYIIDVNYTAFTEFLGFGGIQDAGEPPVSSGLVTVVYTFVPEPASLGLLACGALAFIRRR